MHLAEPARPPARTVAVLGMLSTFGPLSRLILVAGLAPVIAPILGGQLSRIMTWRGIFGALAGFDGDHRATAGRADSSALGHGERCRLTALPLGIVTTTASLCAITSFVGLVVPVVRARISRQRP